MTGLHRRALLGLGVAVLCWPAQVLAGSYLDRAALLVFESRTAAAYLRKRLNDVDSAKMVHAIALARVTAANEMSVPQEVTQAHPHLLLMLENYERAAAAAVERRPDDFIRFQGLALDEERLLVAILEHLGWQLPKLKA